MTPRSWPRELHPDEFEIDAPRPGANAIAGLSRHAVRTERALGLILWIGLFVVLVVSSL